MNLPAISAEPLPILLTCVELACQQTFGLDPAELEEGTLACPVCGGWTFHVTPVPGGGLR